VIFDARCVNWYYTLMSAARLLTIMTCFRFTKEDIHSSHVEIVEANSNWSSVSQIDTAMLNAVIDSKPGDINESECRSNSPRSNSPFLMYLSEERSHNPYDKFPLILNSSTSLSKISNRNSKWTNPNAKRWCGWGLGLYEGIVRIHHEMYVHLVSYT